MKIQIHRMTERQKRRLTCDINLAASIMWQAQAAYEKATGECLLRVAKAVGYAKPKKAVEIVQASLMDNKRNHLLVAFDSERAWQEAFTAQTWGQIIEWSQEDILRVKEGLK